MYIPSNTIIAAGPVIIEEGKVLLDREMKDGTPSPYLMFPGGKVERMTEPFEATAIREAHEELGIDITIMRPLRPLILPQLQADGYIILLHYLATRSGNILPAPNIAEYGWYDIHHLPKDAAPNVVEIIANYLDESTAQALKSHV